MAVAVTLLGTSYPIVVADTASTASLSPTAGCTLYALVYRNGGAPVTPAGLSGTWTAVGGVAQQTASVKTGVFKCTDWTGTGAVSVTVAGAIHSVAVLQVTGSNGLVVQSAETSLSFQGSSSVAASLATSPTGTTVGYSSQGVPRAASISDTNLNLPDDGNNLRQKAAYATPGQQTMTTSWGFNTEQATFHIFEIGVAAAGGGNTASMMRRRRRRGRR